MNAASSVGDLRSFAEVRHVVTFFDFVGGRISPAGDGGGIDAEVSIRARGPKQVIPRGRGALAHSNQAVKIRGTVNDDRVHSLECLSQIGAGRLTGAQEKLGVVG